MVLRRHVLEPLIDRCVDDEYGGFLTEFDGRWRLVGAQTKSLEHAARSTTAFALLDRALPGEGCDEIARRGARFLQQVMWEPEFGGFYAQVTRDGQPQWDGLKHPHAVTYAAIAFDLCSDLLEPGEAATWVANAVGWLDQIAWDPVHGGYWGSYRRDNQLYGEADQLPTASGRDPLDTSPGFKEVNTQSDALDMLGTISTGGSTERLDWMVALFRDRLIDAYGVLPYLYRRNWRMAPCQVRAGHLFQTSHRLLAVARDDSEVVTACCRLVDFCLKTARHRDGGFVYAVTADGPRWPDTGAASETRLWWVQFEALRALHALSRHRLVDAEAQSRYREERDRLWSFIGAHYLDDRHGGVWERPRTTRTARATTTRKSHPWKDAYHETAALNALMS